MALFEDDNSNLVTTSCDDIMPGTSRANSQIWINLESNTCAMVKSFSNGSHSRLVIDNPNFFGIDEPVEDEGLSYFGPALYAAMKEGWVRLLIDIRAQETNSNIEGTDIKKIKRCVKWLLNKKPNIQSLFIAVRYSGDDNNADVYLLHDHDRSLEAFAKYGRLNDTHMVTSRD